VVPVRAPRDRARTAPGHRPRSSAPPGPTAAGTTSTS